MTSDVNVVLTPEREALVAAHVAAETARMDAVCAAIEVAAYAAGCAGLLLALEDHVDADGAAGLRRAQVIAAKATAWSEKNRWERVLRVEAELLAVGRPASPSELAEVRSVPAPHPIVAFCVDHRDALEHLVQFALPGTGTRALLDQLVILTDAEVAS
jgi:hypothetical protein